MEIGLSEVIKFCTRKLIKRKHIMSFVKMISQFEDMMPHFSPKNLRLDVSRSAIVMFNSAQLKPKNQVLCVRETYCEALHFCWSVEYCNKFSKKKK